VSTSYKERAIRVIEDLPPEAGLDQVMERLYFLHKVERGLRQIETGGVVTHEEARRRLKRA
jgi:predicted transcriptional regulator